MRSKEENLKLIQDLQTKYKFRLAFLPSLDDVNSLKYSKKQYQALCDTLEDLTQIIEAGLEHDRDKSDLYFVVGKSDLWDRIYKGRKAFFTLKVLQDNFAIYIFMKELYKVLDKDLLM